MNDNKFRQASLVKNNSIPVNMHQDAGALKLFVAHVIVFKQIRVKQDKMNLDKLYIIWRSNASSIDDRSPVFRLESLYGMYLLNLCKQYTSKHV